MFQTFLALAQDATDVATTVATAEAPDFSLLALFARATFTVKLVMTGLTLMTFWSWSIIILKEILFRASWKEAAIFDRATL